MPRRFLLVTPAHNEAEQVESLVNSVRRSSLQPGRWLVIDDCSDDGTGDLFREHGSDLPFLEVHRIEEPGQSPGVRIAEVLRVGMERLAGDLQAYEYLGILDADIRVGPQYWASLADHMDAEPRRGICSGALWCLDDDGRPLLEGGQRLDLPRGGLRLIRCACLLEAGGIALCRAWDPVMTIRARAAGWETDLLPSVLAETARHTGARVGWRVGGIAYGQRDWNLGRPLWQVLLLATAAGLRGRPGLAFGRLEGWWGQALARGERLDDAVVRNYYRWQRPGEWAALLWDHARGRASRYHYLPRRVVDVEKPAP